MKNQNEVQGVSNINNVVVQAEESNIGRLAMITRGGQERYGLIESVALLGKNKVYGFVTSWADTWLGCLVYASQVTWVKNSREAQLATDAVEKYITCETGSLKAAIKRYAASGNGAMAARTESILEGVCGLRAYL